MFWLDLSLSEEANLISPSSKLATKLIIVASKRARWRERDISWQPVVQEQAVAHYNLLQTVRHVVGRSQASATQTQTSHSKAPSNKTAQQDWTQVAGGQVRPVDQHLSALPLKVQLFESLFSRSAHAASKLE